jgi:hypothetical protein
VYSILRLSLSLSPQPKCPAGSLALPGGPADDGGGEGAPADDDGEGAHGRARELPSTDDDGEGASSLPSSVSELTPRGSGMG